MKNKLVVTWWLAEIHGKSFASKKMFANLFFIFWLNISEIIFIFWGPK